MSTTSTRPRPDILAGRVRIVAAGLAAVVAVVLGAAGLTMMSRADAQARQVRADGLRPVEAVDEMRAVLMTTSVIPMNQLSAVSSAVADRYVTMFAADQRRMTAAFAAYQAAGPADGATFRTLRQQWQAFTDVVTTTLFPAGAARDMVTWNRVRTDELGPISGRIRQAVTTLHERETAVAASAGSTAADIRRQSRMPADGMMITAAAAALIAGLLVIRPPQGTVRSSEKPKV